MTATAFFTALDTGPDFTALLNTNITGATVTLRIRRPDDTLISRTATIVDAPTGSISMLWAADDLTLTGDYLCVARVVYAGGKRQTFRSADGGPVVIPVVADV